MENLRESVGRELDHEESSKGDSPEPIRKISAPLPGIENGCLRNTVTLGRLQFSLKMGNRVCRDEKNLYDMAEKAQRKHTLLPSRKDQRQTDVNLVHAGTTVEIQTCSDLLIFTMGQDALKFTPKLKSLGSKNAKAVPLRIESYLGNECQSPKQMKERHIIQ